MHLNEVGTEFLTIKFREVHATTLTLIAIPVNALLAQLRVAAHHLHLLYNMLALTLGLFSERRN